MEQAAAREVLIGLVDGVLSALRRRREVINGLNVFPVPDGDTGTNMYLTMLAASWELKNRPESSLGGALLALANGALMGSRGNSGVILSQFLMGACRDIASFDEPGIPEYLAGMRAGVRLAYEAIQEPREGTILTVLRETVDGLGGLESRDTGELLVRAHTFGCRSLSRTPELLPALARAGVVDAGGAGIVAAIEGMLDQAGVPYDPFDWHAYPRAAPAGRCYSGPSWGVRFAIDCTTERLAELRSRLAPLGESLIVGGASPPYQVHIHSDRPQSVLDEAGEIGSVSGARLTVLVEPAGGEGDTGPPSRRVGVVACCLGKGLTNAFKELGAHVVPGGPGKRPATGEILEMIGVAGGDLVVVLPDDPDTAASARAAADRSAAWVEVIPTDSPVQGLAAMEAFFEQGDPFEVLTGMMEAAERVRSGSVTRAVRAADTGDLKIRRGQYIGFIGARPVCAEDEIDEAAASVCAGLVRSYGGRLFTFIKGEDLTEAQARSVEETVAREFPEPGFEWCDGGQPHSLLLIGLE